MPQKSLSLFHPVIQKWFTAEIGKPTNIQQKSWPIIANGDNILLTAPTGCGKTLSAFLWALNCLINSTWTLGRTSVLYISPLIALNNDIQRNLITPLNQLRDYFQKQGDPMPDINVLTRSGDTTSSERRLMLKKPPEILITTPESLNILLTSKSGLTFLTNIKTVILDEIHAVLNSKRGTHLISAIERLTLYSGEFQRIALSATVKPLEKVADFVAGYKIINGPNDQYEKKKIHIVQSEDEKQYDIKVDFPANAREEMIDDSCWPVLAKEFKRIIKKNNSTLFFTNSRRITEKLSRLINEEETDELAYSHHSSLSKEIRLAVEEKLKNGELQAIISTSTLELGIDIGSLDEVIMVASPYAVSSAIQRLGRAGHMVGEKSTGVIYPLFGSDFIHACVIARAVMEKDIEDLRIIECPLDVLSQIILSMACTRTWDIDELFYFIRSVSPFRYLKRKSFNLVLDMLAGRYADSLIKELQPRISIDRLENRLQVKKNASFFIFMAGGTITDRGYYNLRLSDSKTKIGELDEEFVWERKIGETFLLGNNIWRITSISHNDVEVQPAKGNLNIIPFWRAIDQMRDFHFSEKILLFLEKADKNFEKIEFRNELINDYYMSGEAAQRLISFVQRQKNITDAPLPHRHHILLEHYQDPFNRNDSQQILLHTFWGGSLNYPFSFCLAEAWEQEYGYPLQVFSNNEQVLAMLPHDIQPDILIKLVKPENVETLLRQKMEKTGFFGAAFRENAQIAMLLLKQKFNQRMPLWLNRLRAKKLMQSVMKYKDFPILLETWRECLNDYFNLPQLKIMLEELQSGEITVTQTLTPAPSPLASGIIWRQINKYMYEDDTPDGSKMSQLKSDLIRELVFSSPLRPQIPKHIIDRFEGKLKRTQTGWAPDSPEDLLDWIKQRILIPENEWQELLDRIKLDFQIKPSDWLTGMRNRIIKIKLPNSDVLLICDVENIPFIEKCFELEKGSIFWCFLLVEHKNTQIIKSNIDKAYHYLDSQEKDADNFDFAYSKPLLIKNWLKFYPPVTFQFLEKIFGLDIGELQTILSELESEQEIVIDPIRENAVSPEICDSDNLESLLRMMRKSRQQTFQPLPVDLLPCFLADFQGLIKRENNAQGLQKIFDQLFAYPVNLNAWEEYIFPARFEYYYSAWLDSLIQNSDLTWFGCGHKKISFCFKEDLGLIQSSKNTNENIIDPDVKKEKITKIFPLVSGKYSFSDLLDYSHLKSKHLADGLWGLCWQGIISNDSYSAYRQGVLHNFSATTQETHSKPTSRIEFNRWKNTRPLQGNWFVLPFEKKDYDTIEELELTKQRIRFLLNRYGIIFRELLQHELKCNQWSELFTAFRLMELSGEILSGVFFQEISGVQFISHDAFRLLQNYKHPDDIFWINACDPASICGKGLEPFKGQLPARINTNYLVYHGSRIVIICQGNGREIQIKVSPDDLNLNSYLQFFKVLLTREYNPVKKISLLSINNEPSLNSPYQKPLSEFGFRRSHKGLELWKT